MANLAIEGHSKRGSEVIARLKMLGGMNTFNLNGSETNCYYYIDNNNRIYHCLGIDPRNYIYYTLEEFLEKFPYKVGDNVSSKYIKNYKIEKMEWEDTNNRVIYKLQGMGWYNSDKLEYYKEETTEERQYKELRMPLDDDDKLAIEVTIGGNKILPPNGYLIGKITQVDNGMLVEYVKQKPQYPKTYKECCRIIDYYLTGATIIGYEKPLLENLQRLLICRDAYWKIAGEQMGLDKPWKYDMSKDEFVYAIVYQYGYIQKCEVRYKNHILAFPTPEMRDTFYENFKDLIEQCKELL